MRDPSIRLVFLAAVVAIAAAACHRSASVVTTPAAPARAASIVSANDLLTAMHDRYASKWYHNLTFVQKSTFLRDSANPRVETWYEAGAMPGKLRIDLGSPSLGNGVLYRGDSAYTFQGGRLADRRAGRNPLLI